MDIYIKRRNYFLYCEKLKEKLFDSLFPNNTNKYNSKDELSLDIFEPMFDSIISASLFLEAKVAVQKDIKKLLEYYGFNSDAQLKRICNTIFEQCDILKNLYNEAKEEQSLNKNYEMERLNKQKLESELDEYLRIGEDIEKE